MRSLDIRFKKEIDKKTADYQLVMLEKLQNRLPKRIAEKFPDVQVRIRFSSSSGFDLSGFKGEEKEAFLAFLEELWTDDSLVE